MIGDKTAFILVMQRRNIETRIDNRKSVPTAELISGPKLIVRLNRAELEKAGRCLPRPSST